MVPHSPERALGECLQRLVPDVGRSSAEEIIPVDVSWERLAAATPFVRRMRVLSERLAEVEAMTLASAVTVMAGAAPTGHVFGSISSGRSFHGYMALVGGAATVLSLHEERGAHLVTPGPEPDLAVRHPLAVWGEAFMPTLVSDPVDIVTPDAHTRRGLLRYLPVSVFQTVVHARQVRVRTIADMLIEESVALNRLDRRPGGWSRSRVMRYLNVVLSLLAEMGVASWDGQRDPEVRCTPLGLFGNLLLQAGIDGPWPELDEMIQSHGYARCGDGYVNLADVGMSHN